MRKPQLREIGLALAVCFLSLPSFAADISITDQSDWDTYLGTLTANTIPAADTLNISGSFDVLGTQTVVSNGVWNIGTVTIEIEGSLTNNGTFNGGSTFDINDGGVFTNSGPFTTGPSFSSAITSAATVNNNSVWDLSAGGYFDNAGTLNNCGTILLSSTSSDNTGTINNGGTISGGPIITNPPIDNPGVCPAQPVPASRQGHVYWLIAVLMFAGAAVLRRERAVASS